MKKPEAYLKIGIYQSVTPIAVPPGPSCDLTDWIPGKRFHFLFRDSGAVEEDGVPIWTAYGLEVS